MTANGWILLMGFVVIFAVLAEFVSKAFGDIGDVWKRRNRRNRSNRKAWRKRVEENRRAWNEGVAAGRLQWKANMNAASVKKCMHRWIERILKQCEE